MASLIELVKLNNEGDLGKMLTEKFKGEIGRLLPRKDMEFMIGFASREATPSPEDIRETVTEHYTRLGYKVEPEEYQRKHGFDAIVFFDTRDQGCIYIVITTFYPLVFGDEHKHICVETSVFA